MPYSGGELNSCGDYVFTAIIDFLDITIILFVYKTVI
jgi:hypothetical protein